MPADLVLKIEHPELQTEARLLPPNLHEYAQPETVSLPQNLVPEEERTAKQGTAASLSASSRNLLGSNAQATPEGRILLILRFLTRLMCWEHLSGMLHGTFVTWAATHRWIERNEHVASMSRCMGNFEADTDPSSNFESHVDMIEVMMVVKGMHSVVY